MAQRNPDDLKDPKDDGLISIRLSIQARHPVTRQYVAWPMGKAALTFKAMTPDQVEKALTKLERFLQNGCK